MGGDHFIAKVGMRKPRSFWFDNISSKMSQELAASLETKPLRECNDNSLQHFADIIMKFFVVTQSLVPRPHKVTIRVVQHLVTYQITTLKLSSTLNCLINVLIFISPLKQCSIKHIKDTQ